MFELLTELSPGGTRRENKVEMACLTEACQSIKKTIFGPSGSKHTFHCECLEGQRGIFVFDTHNV